MHRYKWHSVGVAKNKNFKHICRHLRTEYPWGLVCHHIVSNQAGETACNDECERLYHCRANPVSLSQALQRVVHKDISL
jgi:hypothetical protein